MNETPEKKDRWEQHKDTTCCFEQILEAASNKMTAIWPLTSYFTNHSSKMNKTYWVQLEKLG